MDDFAALLSDNTEPPPPAPEPQPQPPPAPEPPSPEPQPQPAPEPHRDARGKRVRRKIPSAIFDESGAQVGTMPGKAKEKGAPEPPPPPSASHADCSAFAGAFGPILNMGFSMVAEMVQSPLRAETHSVWTVEFPEPEKGVPPSFSKAAVQRTPGEAVAYQLARATPALSSAERWLREHPIASGLLISVAAAAQFGFACAMTSPLGVPGNGGGDGSENGR